MAFACARRVSFVTLGWFIASAGWLPVRADQWTNWRGPDQNGTSRETSLPLAWSETAGVAWKCALPAWGHSTPIVWNESLFLTTHVDDQRLVLIKVDKRSGQIVWTREVGTGSTPHAASLNVKSGESRRQQKFHPDQNLANPSCVTDGEVVVTHFGNGDLAAYDLAGQQLWHRNLQDDHGRYNIWWGHANSPVLSGDLVISVCMQDSCRDLPGEPSPSYVVAHRKRTGERAWFTLRPTEAPTECGDSYVTPLLRSQGATTELVVMGGQILDAYDVATGRRLWWLPGLEGNRVIAGPVLSRDMAYITQGMRRPLLAVKLGGSGARPLDDVAWKYERGTSDSPTPALWGECLCFITNDGFATCLDARSGTVHWRERLPGQYRASPLVADGRVYFLNTAGLTTVVAAADSFTKLAENTLDDETLASPIVSEGRIYLRGRKSLYCLGK
jgi:outer membrane protein assembly factor BamB